MLRKESFLTPEGLKQLQDEMDNLKKVRRKEVAEDISKASEALARQASATAVPRGTHATPMQYPTRTLTTVLPYPRGAPRQKDGTTHLRRLRWRETSLRIVCCTPAERGAGARPDLRMNSANRLHSRLSGHVRSWPNGLRGATRGANALEIKTVAKRWQR